MNDKLNTILVKCINNNELNDLMSALKYSFNNMQMGYRFNKRKKELKVGDTKFKFVTINQNIDGIRFNRVMHAYDFYKDGEK